MAASTRRAQQRRLASDSCKTVWEGRSPHTDHVIELMMSKLKLISFSTGSSCSDSQRTSVSCVSTSSQLPTRLQLGAKTSSMLPSRTTGHCEKGGKMVTPACLTRTEICASLMLERFNGGELVVSDYVESRYTNDLGWSRSNFL